LEKLPAVSLIADDIIQDDQVRLGFFDFMEILDAIGVEIDFIALLGQDLFKQFQDLAAIVNNHNPCPHRALLIARLLKDLGLGPKRPLPQPILHSRIIAYCRPVV